MILCKNCVYEKCRDFGKGTEVGFCSNFAPPDYHSYRRKHYYSSKEQLYAASLLAISFIERQVAKEYLEKMV
jgi:hypothetical protein